MSRTCGHCWRCDGAKPKCDDDDDDDDDAWFRSWLLRERKVGLNVMVNGCGVCVLASVPEHARIAVMALRCTAI
jgi:hypothetical protein